MIGGTVTYPDAKKFDHYYEDSGSGTDSFGFNTTGSKPGSASTVHVVIGW